MRSRVISTALIVGLVATTCIIMAPATSHALRPNEVETNFFTCPPDKEVLADCTWNGMRFCPCDSICWTEGIADGNYKIVHSESCTTGNFFVSCAELQSGAWIAYACLQ